MLDLDAKTILDGLQWLIIAAVSLVTWLRKPGEDAAKAVDALRSELSVRHGQTSERITRVEEGMKHMPTSEALAKLDGKVSTTQAETEGQSKNLDTMRAQLNRIENYLLNRK